MKIRIYYHDTDCGGVVYYANYLKYLEEARTDFLEKKGILIKELSDGGTLFVVARQEIDYKYPGRYGDILEVATKICDMGNVKLVYEHEIKNQDGKLLCSAKTFMVCIGKDFKPKAIPETIREKLKG